MKDSFIMVCYMAKGNLCGITELFTKENSPITKSKDMAFINGQMGRSIQDRW